jgi:hypothetical protein
MTQKREKIDRNDQKKKRRKKGQEKENNCMLASPMIHAGLCG